MLTCASLQLRHLKAALQRWTFVLVGRLASAARPQVVSGH